MSKPLLCALALALLPVGTLLTGCQGPKRAVGIQKVDSLVGRVERVHYDAELGIQSAQDAVTALRSIVLRDFQGPAVKAFETFIEALEVSEKQAERLRADVAPMHQAAAEVYQRWSDDVDGIASPSLRERSRERRDRTVALYADLDQTLTPSLAALDGFNRILRDHALFLSNDLNTSSIEVLEPELEALRGQLTLLEDLLRATMDAARAYVRQSAPLGQVDVVREQSAAADAEKSAKR